MKTFKELQTKLAEDQYSAEYIIKHYVDPVTGENKTRKVRPHRVTFANSKMGGEPVQQDDMKEGYVSANSAPDIQPQMNEGKMGQIHADIEDHLGKHLSNYKKMGGSEHFGNKTVEAAKKISKAHGIAQHHAQKLVNDYVDSALKESDESWAAAMEKQKKDRLTDKDKGTLGKIADMMAKEKAKREFDLKMKKAQNSQRVAKALGEDKKEDLPFTPDKPKSPVAKAGKYGQGYSTARHLARQAMKKMTKEDVNLTEEHVVHVSDGSKYDEEPHKDDVKHVNDGVKKHGGTFDGHSDKGAFFKFKSHSDAENFRRHVNACPKRSCSANHLDESVNEAVDKEHPIYKEYQALRKMPIKDLRNHIKQQHRIIDTSEFRTKEHAASHIINTKHGNKRVRAVFGEETELDEKYDHGPIDREAKVKVGHHAAVVAGSGVDSGKHGKVIGQSKTHIGDQWHIKTADGEVVKMYKNRVAKLKEESELNEAYRLPSDSEIDKVKAHVKANHPNKSLAQVAVHKQSKKIEYVVKDKDGKMTGHTLGEAVEQIDEISKQTLGNYIKRSSHDAALSARHGGSDPKELKNAIKRLKGIAKATNKLTKEETEQIEEASKINWPKEVPSDRDALRAHNRDDEDRDPHPYVNPYDQGARKHSEPKKNVKEEKRGLWANIHAKRKRIKSGSGERMRKPGSKGAPTDAALKAAAEEVHIDEATVTTRQYSWGKMKTVHHDKSFSIPLHPEHHERIAKLKDQQEHKFKDETGRHWTAKRDGDNVHFASANNGPKTSVKHSQIAESRGHKILATALGNIERWKNVSFDQPKYTEKGIETPKKDAESKEKKQMVSKEENEKVYDEKWKKYVGKSFKKATE